MKINFIGSGNLAWNLSKELQKKGFEIAQVYSKTRENAKQLASELNCSFTNNFEKIIQADLFIIAISDTALLSMCNNKILNQIINNSPVVHTAGSVDVDVLSSLSDNYGVFYPLQTFSKHKEVNYKNIPICIEANSKRLQTELAGIASKISNDVRLINSEQRKMIHLSAVFACNFTNYMYSVADKILSDCNVNFDILLPLIQETYEKVKTNSPISVQTGPAKRNDINTLIKHDNLLRDYPNFKEIYKLLSQNIK